MYGRDRLIPPQLSLGVVLVLIVCACSLAVHIVAEGQAYSSIGNGVDLAIQGGHAHYEEQFIYPDLDQLPVEHFTVPLQRATVICAFSISISPLLPPPNS